MEKIQLIKELKALIGSAEVETVLEKLTEFLAKAGDEYNELERMALQAMAQFEKTKKEEALGIISRENATLNYNKVTNTVLQIIDYIEAGERSPGLLKTSTTPWLKKVLIAIISILVLGSGYWVVKNYFLNGQQGQEGNQGQAELCPDFESNAQLNILVLPFRAYDETPLKTHEAIKDNLDQLSDRYRFRISTKTANIDPEKQKGRYPRTLSDAGRIADACQSQLIIWGTTETRQATNETIINTRYKFHKLEQKFKYTKLELDENTELDTVTSISSIAANGVLTENITESIKILFGLIAHNSGEDEAAIELLSQTIPSDTAMLEITQIALADSYMATKQKDMAIASYDKVLEVNPDNSFVLKNRAMLNYEKGEYDKATTDLDRQLMIDKDDTEARYARGVIHLKNNRLNKAREDLKGLEKQKPNDRRVKTKMQELNSKVRIEQAKKQDAEAALRQEPANVEALTNLTESSKNLGLIDNAISTAQNLLRNDPGNPTAFKTIIDGYLEKKDTSKAEQWKNRASNLGVKEKLDIDWTRFQPFKPVNTATIKKEVEKED